MPLSTKGDAMRYRARYHQKPYPGFYGGADCSIEFDSGDDNSAWEDFQQHIACLQAQGVTCTACKLLRIDVPEKLTPIRRDLIIISVQVQDLPYEALGPSANGVASDEQ